MTSKSFIDCEHFTQLEIYSTLPYLQDINLHQDYDLHKLSVWDPSMKRLLEYFIVERLQELPTLPIHQKIFESLKIAMMIDFVQFMCGSVNFEPTTIDTKSISLFFPSLELAFNNLNLDCISHDGLGHYKYEHHRLYSVMLEDF